MFSGNLSCDACGYRIGDFMIGYHHGCEGFGVLLQDQVTLALRVLHVPDHDVYAYEEGREERQWTEETAAYENGYVAAHARPSERRVDWIELVDEERGNRLPCPQCRRTLKWTTTGIT